MKDLIILGPYTKDLVILGPYMKDFCVHIRAPDFFKLPNPFGRKALLRAAAQVAAGTAPAAVVEGREERKAGSLKTAEILLFPQIGGLFSGRPYKKSPIAWGLY